MDKVLDESQGDLDLTPAATRKAFFCYEWTHPGMWVPVVYFDEKPGATRGDSKMQRTPFHEITGDADGNHAPFHTLTQLYPLPAGLAQDSTASVRLRVLEARMKRESAKLEQDEKESRE